MVNPLRKTSISRLLRATAAVICSSSLAITLACVAPPAVGQQAEPDRLVAESVGIVTRNQIEVPKLGLGVNKLQRSVDAARAALGEFTRAQYWGSAARILLDKREAAALTEKERALAIAAEEETHRFIEKTAEAKGRATPSDATAQYSAGIIDQAQQHAAESVPDATAQRYQAISASSTQTIALGSSTGSSAAAGEMIAALAGRVRDVVTEAAAGAQHIAEVPAATTNPSAVEAVIARAQEMVGAPYVWGGGDASGPTTGINGGTVEGFDCSGLVLYAFAGAGISLPHYTGYQYQRGTAIDPSQAQRGDLLFWGPNGNQHVAIYLGDGMMLEAPSSGQDVAVNPVRWTGMSPHAVRLL